MTEGLLVLHVFVGLLFAAHGAQKLFGWFNGPGLEGGTGFMGSLGLEPARFNAVAAGLIEFAGGIVIALGLVTPFAAAALIAVMVTAIATVHLANGFFNQDGGVEFNVTLIAALFALTAVGPGDASLDAALNLDLAGFGWALGALAVGIAGGLVTVAAGRALGRRGSSAHPQAA
jgi:putative oxidoreductase